MRFVLIKEWTMITNNASTHTDFLLLINANKVGFIQCCLYGRSKIALLKQLSRRAASNISVIKQEITVRL